MENKFSKLIKIELNENSDRNLSPEQKQERAIAIYDLMENNYFHLINIQGPYILKLEIQPMHVLFQINSKDNNLLKSFFLALGPFRRLIRDYKIICENYYDAIKTKPPSQIQAIDMGRRSVHNEGSKKIIERLSDKVELDDDTARRLFTLICVLKL